MKVIHYALKLQQKKCKDMSWNVVDIFGHEFF
jgi:hypothetical protein